MNKVTINTEFIKLDQFLKWAGIAEHGAAAKAMIQDGIVKVNGEAATQRGKKLYKGYVVSVEGLGEYVIE
ncbi:ribosome-associated protein [Oxobacter pfennigii]|uniref:Ribosome-associated protein n=1 Tax=Oxobacter pfennigii TaxID=36849 RepID=A0A0P8WXA7_9CLOT|nr:S4 domain-containing protein YaaA [Oxobacter pfennigii]KPU42957.1 ribosome-associated protein [Oxobacter pfennigii]